MFILFYQSCVDQLCYTLHQVVSEQLSPNRWLILVLVMAINPKIVIGDCKLLEDRLMSNNNQSKI